MDKAELLDLYRAAYDVVPPGEDAVRYFHEHYEYSEHRGGYVDKEDPDGMAIEPGGNFSITTWMVPRGGGQPACYCYRCPTLLTLDDVLIDSPRAGLYRPICVSCAADIDKET